MKLFTIGDSLSQGVMSGAAARTDLSYSSRIAALWQIPDYRYPDWPENGLPVNLEAVLRHLVQHFGTEIRGLEWLKLVRRVDEVLDRSEDYYERGPGTQAYPDGVTYFHNVASAGFYVADAWQMTAHECEQVLAQKPMRDHFLGVPEASFHRTATRVLNPARDPAFAHFSQLDWLQHHAQTQGIENTLVWLGSNNALGTILNFQMKSSEAQAETPFIEIPRETRRAWNFWKPEHFEADFTQLMSRVTQAMNANRAADWRVYVGTVPHVTIAPICKGVGQKVRFGKRGWYYQYYTYFPFDQEFAVRSGKYLSMQRAIFIDDVIDCYNETIRRLVKAANQRLLRQGDRRRYFVVDLSKALDQLAYKRNNGRPKYDLPKFFQQLNPGVNSLYYHANTQSQLEAGGLFSLDGVHPSPLLQGLIAHEFLKVMRQAGVPEAANYQQDTLPWEAILASDALYNQPIPIMAELYEHLHLAKLFIQWCHFMNWGAKTPDRWWF